MCSIVPPYMLRKIAAQNEPRLRAVARAAKESLLHIKDLQAIRTAPIPPAPPSARQAKPGPPKRTILMLSLQNRCRACGPERRGGTCWGRGRRRGL